MKFFKNKLFWAFILSSLGTVIGYVFLYPIQFNICTADFERLIFDSSCINETSLVGIKLFFSFLALTIGFVILLLAPKAVPLWRTFALWYVPIVGLAVAFSEPSTSMWKIGPAYEEYIHYTSALYVIGVLSAALGGMYKVKYGKTHWFLNPTVVVLSIFFIAIASYTVFLFSVSK